MSTPQHEHDCSVCEFVGRLGTCDFYVHPGDFGMISLVVRYSSDGPDYVSNSISQPQWDVDFEQYARRYGKTPLSEKTVNTIKFRIVCKYLDIALVNLADIPGQE